MYDNISMVVMLIVKENGLLFLPRSVNIILYIYFLTRIPMLVVVVTPIEIAIQVQDATNPAEDFHQLCVEARVGTLSTKSHTSNEKD